jgi:hypothetical protein
MDFCNERCVGLEELMPLIRRQLEQGQPVKFSPRGTSMLPMLRQGRDSIVLSPVPAKLKKYDLPLYRRDNGQYVLHRVIRVGDAYTCMGDNQFVPELGLRHEQMIGLVTAFCRDEKEIPVTNIAYRLYCRLWHFSRPLRHLWRRGIGWIRRHMAE